MKYFHQVSPFFSIRICISNSDSFDFLSMDFKILSTTTDE